jgi:ABC-type glycerol-3-phosphate transport system substrate-binding protein
MKAPHFFLILILILGVVIAACVSQAPQTTEITTITHLAGNRKNETGVPESL